MALVTLLMEYSVINMRYKFHKWIDLGYKCLVGEFFFIDRFGNYGITNEVEIDDAPKPDKQLTESQMLRELGKDREARKHIYAILSRDDKRIRYFLPQKKGSGRITQEMVDSSKDFPVEQLLDFDNRNTTKCIWAEHSTARLSKPRDRNFVKCFACDRSADSIEIYKVLHNCDFKTAVRSLSK